MPSDPTVFDEFKLPFIFVPHGAAEPTEWLERHRDYIKLPATMVPRLRNGGPANPSPPNPSFGQQRTQDGFAASPDPGASGSPTGNAIPDAASGGTNKGAGRAGTPDDPVAAFRRADAALETAASDYVSMAGHPTPSTISAGNADGPSALSPKAVDGE
jgi:hypothetical protein